MEPFDVIVIGLGGVGSAACWRLAGRGARALGIEQFSRAHGLGSSHGETRIVRRSYLPRPELIPLLHRSYALWTELEREAGRPLFSRAGLLVAAPATSPEVPADAARVAARHGVTVEALDAAEARRRFPALAVPEGYRAYFEPDAGYVAAEATVEACCRLAEARGAQLRFHEEVHAFVQRDGHVEVTTTKGTYRAAALVIAAGPWSGRLLAELEVPLVVRRIPQLWFQAPERRAPGDVTPCFCFDLPYGSFYGVPAVRGGRMKIGGGGERRAVPDPSRLDRQIQPEDLAPVQRFIAQCVPGVSGAPAQRSMCMCTMTPDERFVIDRHPAQERVVIAAGLSGHGFKFCPAIGDMLADMTGGTAPAPLEWLRLRWGAARRPPAAGREREGASPRA